MMLLAIDTTSTTATAALFRNGTLIAQREADASKKHAVTVLPLIDTILEENGVTIGEIDRFAVDIGPGSFTGVRIGVSLANALACASGKPVVAVDSLFTLALSTDETEKPVCAMIDARNGNAYAALYQAGRAIIEPCAVEIESFCAKLPEGTIFVGDVRTQQKTYPVAKFVGLAALRQGAKAGAEAEPMYLRPSQAERAKKQSAKEA